MSQLATVIDARICKVMTVTPDDVTVSIIDSDRERTLLTLRHDDADQLARDLIDAGMAVRGQERAEAGEP